ncbi:prolyl oligopeptidase family serine peptidase [Streptomyces sp. 184]|uniref:S9 family peptidase n=1 Tax=Streptomyces sp. 184 TaxID=1827526 RepID=UPI00389298BF
MNVNRAPEFPRQLARTRKFTLGLPHAVTVSPDGERVLFLRTGSGADPVARLWLYQEGAERELADPAGLARGGAEPVAERVRRERARTRTAGVTSYTTDSAVRLAVFALGGELWAVRTDGSAPFRVPAAGPAVDPRLSPDGRHVAYVTGGALHVVPVAGGGDLLLAAPDGPDVTYGLPEHVAAESMHRSRGHWWAPDGHALLVARVDETDVQRWHLADPADPAAEPRTVRYPTAGTTNADVSLYVVTLDGRRTEVAWDRTAYEYLATVRWDAHGPLLGVQSRDQRTLLTLAADPGTGATRVLAETRDAHWTRLVPGTPARTASGALLQVTNDTATDTYRLVRDGEPVTPAGLQVRAVLGVTGERVLFTAAEDPTQRHVWAYEPGPGCTRLSDEAGHHTATAGGATTVLESVTPAGSAAHVLASGRPGAALASLAEEPVLRPGPLHLDGPDGLRANLFLPSWHRPGGGRLPVLLDPYGGPGLRLAVPARGWWTLVSQWFAEQGFAVLVTDGRATPGAPSWERMSTGDKRDTAVADQVQGLHAAAAGHPDLDLDRVGIRGWSFGGFLAAAAVLTRPDVFHAAVAGAPVTDARLYDTHYQERFLGHPAKHPEHYDRSSLVGLGHRLRRPLLLVHGLADDNVVAAHTLRLSAELLAAGRPHSVLPVPGASHMISDDAIAENLLWFELAFLRRELNADPPPYV